MKPPFKTNLESNVSRVERVFAIKKAVQAGSYKVDSTEVANILINHIVNPSMRLHRSPLERQCFLN
jgi:hypothetical protein